MYEAIEKALTALKAGIPVRPLSVAPYATLNITGTRVDLNAMDLGDYTVSTLQIKAPLGIIHAQLLVITPLRRDAPACLCAFLHSPGKDTMHMEALNTLLSPDSFEDLVRVRAAHTRPADHVSTMDWYEAIKLPGCICRDLKPNDKETLSLFADWMAAYTAHMRSAPACDENTKAAHARAVVDTHMLADGDMIRQLYNMMGEERARGLFRKAFFPKD